MRAKVKDAFTKAADEHEAVQRKAHEAFVEHRNRVRAERPDFDSLPESEQVRLVGVEPATEPWDTTTRKAIDAAADSLHMLAQTAAPGRLRGGHVSGGPGAIGAQLYWDE
jgi:hypothetical protein